MPSTDPIAALRQLLPPQQINFQPKPELLRIIHQNQQRIVAELPRIMAFEFSSPDFLLQLETLRFGDNQLFRLNSEGHFRGSVDFSLLRQRWFFPQVGRLGTGPVLESLTDQQTYSNLGHQISRWIGKDHLIIVEYLRNGQQFDQQWRNGNIQRDWYLKGSITASGTHVHIQPDMNDPVLRNYIKAEYEYAGAVGRLDHAFKVEFIVERASRNADLDAQQARDNARLAAQDAALDAENQQKQERLNAANAAAVAKEREAEAAKEKLENSRRQREQREKEEEAAKKQRDEAEIPKVELGRYANDPEGIKISFFEYILAILKASVSATEEIEKEDAYDFYRSILKRFEELRDNFRSIGDALNNTHGQWFGEDQDDWKRYLDDVLKFLGKQNVEVDPSLGNVPWCGTSFLHNVDLAISLNYFSTESQNSLQIPFQ